MSFSVHRLSAFERRVVVDCPVCKVDLVLTENVYYPTAIYDAEGRQIGTINAYHPREPLPPATPEALDQERKRRSCCDPPRDT